MNRKCERARIDEREREREQTKFINKTLNAKTNGKSNEEFSFQWFNVYEDGSKVWKTTEHEKN